MDELQSSQTKISNNGLVRFTHTLHRKTARELRRSAFLWYCIQANERTNDRLSGWIKFSEWPHTKRFECKLSCVADNKISALFFARPPFVKSNEFPAQPQNAHIDLLTKRNVLVFFFSSQKYPSKTSWTYFCGIFICALGMVFTWLVHNYFRYWHFFAPFYAVHNFPLYNFYCENA